jgi:hypothetical protein
MISDTSASVTFYLQAGTKMFGDASRNSKSLAAEAFGSAKTTFQ